MFYSFIMVLKVAFKLMLFEGSFCRTEQTALYGQINQNVLLILQMCGSILSMNSKTL